MFPLLSQAVRFYNHKESMVRTSVRNITLTIFKGLDKKIKSENLLFFSEEPNYRKLHRHFSIFNILCSFGMSFERFMDKN